MREKFLKEAVATIIGKASEGIVDLINANKHVNEFNIAKKMDLTINQTRNLLYRLSDFGLVSSIRKKDKKKGWYTYFWKIEVIRTLNLLKEKVLNKRIQHIKSQIRKREENTFYVCDRCKIELDEEHAMLNNFTCDECGDIFTVRDNEKMLKDLNRILARLNKDLELVDLEIDIEKKKIEKKKERKQRKEEKEAAEKKLQKKLERAEARKKKKEEEEKSGKKVAKKKVAKKAIKKVVKKKVAKKATKKVSKKK